MAHGKRLSINQYRVELSTVFRLDFISCRRGMGISLSVYQEADKPPSRLLQLLVGPRESQYRVETSRAK